MRERRKPLRITRDIVSYVVGIAGIIYETLVEKADRPSLLLVFAAMIALPKVLGRDEREAAEAPDPAPPPVALPPPAPPTAPPIEEGPAP